LNSGFKTKSGEIEWRRAKNLELKSQGLDQREITNTLHVSETTVSFDLQHLRDEARQNVHDYTTKLYPLQFKISLISIQKCMKEYWNIAQTTSDNKEKMQALEHYRQTHIDMMAMLQGGGSNLENMAKEKRPQYGNVKAHYTYQDDDTIT
jgi:orotate phosphoribosyltransferase-like protein